jgi:hypothetical protein
MTGEGKKPKSAVELVIHSSCKVITKYIKIFSFTLSRVSRFAIRLLGRSIGHQDPRPDQVLAEGGLEKAEEEIES